MSKPSLRPVTWSERPAMVLRVELSLPAPTTLMAFLANSRNLPASKSTCAPLVEAVTVPVMER